MKRLNIIAVVIYLLVLYALITSYIYVSQRQVEHSLSIVASESLDPNQKNLIALWAKSKSKKTRFEDYSVSVEASPPFLAQTQTELRLAQKLDKDGQAILALPHHSSSQGYPQSLSFRLLDHKGETVSEGSLDFSSPKSQSLCPIYSIDEVKLSTPSAFINQQKTAFFLSKASRGSSRPERIAIDSSYGNPEYEASVKLHPPYPSRSYLTLNGPTDLSFRSGDATYYDSLITNERPLSAVLLHSNYTPNTPLQLEIATLGGDGRVTADVYAANAWLDRLIISDSGQKPILLKPEIKFSSEPQVFLLKLCLSSWACGEQADKLAFIASETPLSLEHEARIALQASQRVCPDDAYLDELAKTFQADLKKRALHLNDDVIRNVRDYALYVFAQASISEIALRLKTEDEAKMALQDAQEKHKQFANILLVALFGLGTLVFSLYVLKTRRHRTRGIYAVEGKNELLVESRERLERFQNFLAVFVVIISLLGMLILLYFMMQLL